MNKSKTSLFLMELIIVILFFSISAAVCVQLFFSAHQLDEETQLNSNATELLQNIAECYYGADTDLASVGEMYSDSLLEDAGHLFMVYDASWSPVSPYSEDSEYVACLSDTTPSDTPADGFISSATIAIYAIPDDYIFSASDLDRYELITSQKLSVYNQLKLK